MYSAAPPTSFCTQPFHPLLRSEPPNAPVEMEAEEEEEKEAAAVVARVAAVIILKVVTKEYEEAAFLWSQVLLQELHRSSKDHLVFQ